MLCNLDDALLLKHFGLDPPSQSGRCRPAPVPSTPLQKELDRDVPVKGSFTGRLGRCSPGSRSVNNCSGCFELHQLVFVAEHRDSH